MKHDVHIEHGELADRVLIRCKGKGCPLCVSTAEERARIAFVAAEKRR